MASAILKYMFIRYAKVGGAITVHFMVNFCDECYHDFECIIKFQYVQVLEIAC